MTGVVDGISGALAISYASVSEPSVYQQDNPDACSYPTNCANRGLWGVSSYSVATDTVNPGGDQAYATHAFKYSGAKMDALGGWLGFFQKTETDLTTGAVTTTQYDNQSRQGTAFPKAFLPQQVSTVVQEQGAGSPIHEFLVNTNYGVVAGKNGTYSVRVDGASGLEAINQSTVTSFQTTFKYDAFNTVADRTTITASGDVEETKNLKILNDTTTNWLIGLVQLETRTSTPAGGGGRTRTTSYADYPGPNLLNTMPPEPGSSPPSPTP